MPGSQTALMQQLYDEHAAALFRHCLRLTGQDRARAEDVLQRTLLRAWRHIDELEDFPGSVRAWLFTVARHIVIDEWRTTRNRHEVSVAEVPEPGPAEDITDQQLLSWVVADALRDCGERLTDWTDPAQVARCAAGGTHAALVARGLDEALTAAAMEAEPAAP